MHTLTKLVLATTISSVIAFSASAEIINSDWKVAGDGLTFTDLSTGIEYLDLSQTNNMSIADVKRLLGTTYAGWSLATADQVVTMLTNLLSDTTVQYSSTGNQVEKAPISSRNNIKHIIGAARDYGHGLVSSETNSMYGVYLDDTRTVTFYNYSAHAETFSSSSFGVWLVNDSSLVDVPAPLALSSLALLGFGFMRRKSRS